jgi:uncharacterized RDD family membrane protein YckC
VVQTPVRRLKPGDISPDTAVVSFLEEPLRESVAPPGWTPSPAVGAVTPTAAAAPVAAGPFAAIAPVAAGPVAVAAHPADAAVRWRVRAARIDNLLVYGGYLAACWLLHWRVANAAHLLWLAVAGVAYHFGFEAHSGQTPGKRRYGIKVVCADDGGPASPKAIAIRSLVRVVDSLPVCYVSGLLSMVRTGPERRQRIGDIAAGTMVVAVGGQAASRGTPKWMLPAATIVAIAVSALTVIGFAMQGHQPINSMQTAQFINQCENSSLGAVANCECFLGRVEADGYDTPDELSALVNGAQAEEASGKTGPYRTTLNNALLACRTAAVTPAS